MYGLYCADFENHPAFIIERHLPPDEGVTHFSSQIITDLKRKWGWENVSQYDKIFHPHREGVNKINL